MGLIRGQRRNTTIIEDVSTNKELIEQVLKSEVNVNMDLKGKSVKISAEKYFYLLKLEDELNALQCAGVDNWCGYGEHKEFMADKDDILEEVKESICE